MAEAVATLPDEITLAQDPASVVSSEPRTHSIESTTSVETRSASCPRVLVVGPPIELIGGMSTVVAQQLGLELCDKLEFDFFPLSVRMQSSSTQSSRTGRHISQLLRFRTHLRTSRPIAVHLHTCSGFSFFHSAMLAWIARRCGVKVVLHVHGAAFDRFYAESGALAKRLIRQAMTRADAVVALSREWRERIVQMAPAAKITVIENAVEVGPLKERARGPGACRFLLLSSMDEWKGIDDLLDACERAKSRNGAIEVVLAGPEGSAGEEATLRRKIAQRGLSDGVRYVGAVAPENKSEWFDWADVYVQPSWHEGMPMAVLEAMAVGLPVIATRVGAMPEVVDHRASGLLVDAHDPDGLAAAMLELAGDSDTRWHYGRAGHTIVTQRFGIERFRDDLVRLYEWLRSTRKTLTPALSLKERGR